MSKLVKFLVASIAVIALAMACTSTSGGNDDDDQDGDTTTDAGTNPNTTPEDTNEKCSDTLDNDGDGHVDCDDFSCTRNPAITICPNSVKPENTAEACRNGVDDDQNGHTDCADFACTKADSAALDAGTGFGCIVKTVEKENTDELCSDGISNDGDHYVDCADYDCTKTAGLTACADAGTPGGSDGGTGTPENTDALCSDGVSNDGDRFVDCDDFDCSNNENVTVCPE